MNFTAVLHLVENFDEMVGTIRFMNSQLQWMSETTSHSSQSPLPVDDQSEDSAFTFFTQLCILFILITIGVLTVVGNSLVILCVVLEKSLRTVSNYLLASLSMADLIVGVFMMPLAAYLEFFNHQWPFSAVACNIWLALDVAASTASILGLIAIAYNRYIAIVKPFTYSVLQRNPYIAFWLPLVGIWIISAVIALPVFFGVNGGQLARNGVCSLNNHNYLLYSSIFSFFIPSVLMLGLYIQMFRALAQRAQRSFLRNQQRPGSSNYMAKLQNRFSHQHNDSTRRCRSHSSPAMIPEGRHKRIFRKLKTKKSHSTCASFNRSDESSSKEERQGSSRSIYDETSGVYLGETTTSPCTLENELESPEDFGLVVKSIASNNMIKQGSKDTETDLSDSKRSSDEVVNNGTNVVISSQIATSMTCLAVSTKDALRSKRSRLASSLSKATLSKERKITTMLATVLLLFLICWSPFFASNVINAICAKFNPDQNSQCFVPVSWIRVFVWFGKCILLQPPQGNKHDEFPVGIKKK